jgi:hypothetical protein
MQFVRRKPWDYGDDLAGRFDFEILAVLKTGAP